MVVHGQPRPAGPKEELTLFRAAQEGLTNVRKHARASQVMLTLDYEAPGRVVLTVQDNGIGAAQAEGGFGLLGLRERVQLLGGDIHIDTAPGRGLSLSVAVPG
jgi:signal transduction histidine kinase